MKRIEQNIMNIIEQNRIEQDRTILQQETILQNRIKQDRLEYYVKNR